MVLMEPDVFVRILNQIRGFTDHVYLHVLGEPLLHPKLDLLLAACRDHGLRVNLTTNGTLLPRWWDTLLQEPALRQLNVSLHGPAEQLSLAKLDHYLDTLFAFITEAGPLNPCLINLRLWNLSSGNPNQFNPVTLHILERITATLAPSLNLSANRPVSRGITLGPKLFLSQAERFDWPHPLTLDQGRRGTCRGLRDHVAILSDATVVPCCLDAEADITLGNLNTASFSEIIHNGRATLIREGFTRQQLIEPLCRRCTYRLRFDHQRRPDQAA